MWYGSISQPVNLRSLAFNSTATTGSISASSDQLTVASATGFTIGDQIIIAVGGESGAGIRGTKGVGGTWPALSYADAAAMAADTGQAANTFAYLLDTGRVYRFVSSAWVLFTDYVYYTEKALPRALVTTISGIAGNVLTLATTASVAATNANVYFDNLPIFDAAVALGGTKVTLSMPAGTYAASALFELLNKQQWELKGAGRDATVILHPDGTFYRGTFGANSCSRLLIQDFSFVSNRAADGYGLWVTETDIPQGTAFPYGIFIQVATGGLVRNVKGTNAFQKTVGTHLTTDVWAYNCLSVHTEPLRTYIQWDFQWSSGTRGGCVDCEVDSDYLIAGFEAFGCNGTYFYRPTARNATFSMNAAEAYLIEDFNVTIEENSQFQSGLGTFSSENPIININTNIGPVTLGGTIVRPVMVQEGYINATNDSLRGVVINFGLLSTVVGGSYTAPDYDAATTVYGPWGYDSIAIDSTLQDFTVVGSQSGGPYPNISMINSNATLTNCTAGVIRGPYVTLDEDSKTDDVALSDFNRVATSSGEYQYVRGTHGQMSGKYYCEFTITSLTSSAVGIVNGNFPITTFDGDGNIYFGQSNSSVGLWESGDVYLNDVITAGPSFVEDDVVGMVVDLGSSPKTVKFNVNGGSFSTPLDITAMIADHATIYPGIDLSSGNVIAANFGVTDYADAPGDGSTDWPTS